MYDFGENIFMNNEKYLDELDGRLQVLNELRKRIIELSKAIIGDTLYKEDFFFTYAKLDLVYRNFSEYVHLAEKAFYSSVTTSSSEQYDIEFSVGLPLKEKANPVLLEVANAFVYYVKLQNNLVNQIVISKAGW